MKLNLGCGNTRLNGWLNCDVNPSSKVDKIINLNERNWNMWGLKYNSADEILLDQVLEHLKNPVQVMRNVLLTLKPGGVCTVRVPFAGSYAAWNDPTHLHHFTPATFKYFEKGHDSKHYIWVEFSKVEVKWIDDDSTRLARMRNLIPFRDTLCWLLWSMHDGIEARLTK